MTPKLSARGSNPPCLVVASIAAESDQIGTNILTVCNGLRKHGLESCTAGGLES